MGKRGEGYGSEDHFLRYRSDRPEELNAVLRRGLGRQMGPSTGFIQAAQRMKLNLRVWTSSPTDMTSWPVGKSIGHNGVERRRGTASPSCAAAMRSSGCLSKPRPTLWSL